MLRRWLLTVPLATAAVAAAVAAAGVDALVAAGLGAGVGAAVALALLWVGDRRAAEVASRVEALIGPGAAPAARAGGSQWGRLEAALADAGQTLAERLDAVIVERSRAEQLLNGLPVAVLLFDEQGLAFANPEARRAFALSQVGGRTPLEALGAPPLADAVERVRAVGGTTEVEVVRGDRHLRCRVSETAGGEVALVVTDLTEIRRVEAIRRDFVVNASHELKTPVAGIQALSESLVLAIERDPDRAESMIVSLQREAVRLGQLVRDLLDLARLEEAAPIDEGDTVDLPGVVAGHVERMAAAARARGISIHCDVDDAARVVGRPGDVRLIVANLADNAVAYNREGGDVHLSVRQVDDHVELRVSDTGIGIPVAEQQRIFERFYRIDKHRSRRAGGTGLGLAIVRHAVNRMGGTIAVDSTAGQGTTFTVRLPSVDRSGDRGPVRTRAPG